MAPQVDWTQPYPIDSGPILVPNPTNILIADIKYYHLRRTLPIFLGVTLLFALIEGCITAFLVSRNDRDNSWQSNALCDSTKFLLFTSWWTFVFNIAYLMFNYAAMNSWFSSVLSNLIYVSLTWIFWLCGAAAFTQAVGSGERCGSDTTLLHCNHNLAAEAFAWIQFILFTLLLIAVGVLAFATTRRGDRLSTPASMA